MLQENRSINSFIINKQNNANETTIKLVSGNPTISKSIEVSAIDTQSGHSLPLTINGIQTDRHTVQPLEAIQIKVANINSQGKIKVSLIQNSNGGGISISQKSTNGENYSTITLK